MSATISGPVAVLFHSMPEQFKEEVRELVRDEIKRELARREQEHAAAGPRCVNHEDQPGFAQTSVGRWVCQDCAREAWEKGQ